MVGCDVMRLTAYLLNNAGEHLSFLALNLALIVQFSAELGD